MNCFRWLVSVLHVSTVCVAVSVLLKIAHIRAETCFLGTEMPGWTLPHGDIVLREGSDLDIYCHLDPVIAKNKSYSPTRIFFTRSNNISIPSNSVSVLNETTVVLRLKNLPLLKDHWFYCKLALDNPVISSNNSISSLEESSTLPANETLICYNSVAVGRPPLDVTNFSCISLNLEVLRCTWSVPDNELKTDYRIQYKPVSTRASRNLVLRCPTTDDVVNHTCSWGLSTSPFYRNNLEYLSFTIFGNNTLGNNTQEFPFHHYAHVLANPPQKLTVHETTVSSICLKWENDDALKFFSPGWIYNITYPWNSSNPDSWNYITYKPESLNATLSYNVTHLNYPNTLYNFRVLMRSATAAASGPWSDPATLVAKTKPCRPYVSPRTDSGSFEIVPSSREPTSRQVYIHWQPIPMIEYNGENFRYEIDVYEDDVKIKLEPLALQNSYAKFDIGFGQYTFFVWSANNEGRAANASMVRVPGKATATKLPEILSKIDYGGGEYELSWRMPADAGNVNEIVNYTVYWCETNKEWPHPCDGYIDWTHLPGTAYKYTIRGAASQNYQVAVSANTRTGSSGMVWAACSVLPDRVNKIKKVWLDKIDSYYAVLRWKLECSDRINSIKGYYIHYCVAVPDHSRCSGPMQNVTVYGDLDTDHGNVTDLQPFKYYRISVSMFTSNHTGPQSDALVYRTKDGRPDMRGIVLAATNVTNTSITILWTRPNVTNGKLQHYLISYNDSQRQAAENETTAVLDDLISFETYQIKLQACTILCSMWTPPISVRTKIGKPSAFGQIHPRSINASHVVISWDRPAVPGGPKPRYKVRIRWDGAENETKEQDTADNSTMLDLSNCRSGAYTVDIRAENVNGSQVFEGDWMHAFDRICSNSSGMATIWKVMIGASSLLLIASIFVFWGKKILYRCRQMKKVEVVLPAKFTIPSLFPVDSKECELFEDFGLPPTKSVEEFHTLVDKTTELSLLSSQT